MPTRRTLLLAPLCAAGFLALSACQSTPPRPPSQPIGFTQYGPIVLNAATIDVVDGRRPAANAAGAAAQVGDRSPTPPLEAVRRWAVERLQAAGRTGRVRVVVKDAGITETQLPRKTGLQGYFTNDQAQRYDGRMEVEISGETTAPDGAAFRGTTKASVTHSTTVPENISLADREATLQEMTRRMAEELNARLDAGIRKDLAPMVVR